MFLKRNKKIQFFENNQCQIAKVLNFGFGSVEVEYFDGNGTKVVKILKKDQCSPLPADFLVKEFSVRLELFRFCIFLVLAETFRYYCNVIFFLRSKKKQKFIKFKFFFSSRVKTSKI